MSKFKYPFIITLAFSVLLLTACQKSETDAQSGANKSNEIESAKPKVASEESAQEVTDRLMRLQDKLNEIVLVGDIEGCNELTDESYNQNCQVYILGNKAKDNSDLAVCDSASSENIKENCLSYVKQK